MERCPNCRARCAGEVTCRRCGMDLSPLLAVERAVDGLIAQALDQLARGRAPDAARALTKARALQPAPFIDQLLGFARDLAGERPRSDRPSPAGQPPTPCPPHTLTALTVAEPHSAPHNDMTSCALRAPRCPMN